MSVEPTTPSTPRRSLRKRIALIAAGLVLAYLAAAYVIVPALWLGYARRHPQLEDIPNITYTADGIPGDPINVALIGTRDELLQTMKAAKWYEADPLGLRSDLKIAVDSVLKRPDNQAPVSNLYLFGRKEDLAFEQEVGNSPRHRHHVRFWQSDQVDADGRPVWVGSAVYDERVGVSRTTGQVTHHIGPEVDAERDGIAADLKAAGLVEKVEWVDDFHEEREGKNGGGDPWRTDGRLGVVILKPISQ